MLTKIVVTGMSGTGAGELVQALSEENPDRLTHFDVGNEILTISRERGYPLDPVKILNRPTPLLDSFRTAALERARGLVVEQERRGEDGLFVIDTHALFPWKRELIPALDAYFLRMIEPDMYITVVDNIAAVANRLWNNPQWKWLELDEMLVWRDQELLLTESISRSTATTKDGQAATKHYLVPKATPVGILNSLTFKADAKTVYLSYPISHVPPDLVAEAEQFGNELADAGLAVFNPLAIEDMKLVYAFRDVLADKFPVEAASYVDDADTLAVAKRVMDDLKSGRLSQQQVQRLIEHISYQTVSRDYRLISQSDMVVVIYNPAPLVVKDQASGEDTEVQKAFLSAGVICEMVYGTANDKDVFAVWPLPEEPSPFFLYNATRVFPDKASLLEVFRKTGIVT